MSQKVSQPVPLGQPPAVPPVRVDHAATGAYVPPIQRVKILPPNDWEEIVHEWAHSLKSQYHSVWRCGGAGDMGRDVVAHVGDPAVGGEWDNYQCKHYAQPLTPGDVWLELGKLMHYTYVGEYSVPRLYRFVAPHDVGTKLSKLFQKPDQLRAGLLKEWDAKCRDGIGVNPVPLIPELMKHIEAYPFDSVGFKPVLQLIEEHSKTQWHVHRFGGGLPARHSTQQPPEAPADSELPYLRELLLAYGDCKKCAVADASKLSEWQDLDNHYTLSRRSFYSAESLLEFSRDHLPEGEYERLQEELYDGVQESYLSQHVDGYQKVLATTKAAVHLPITDHALTTVLHSADRRGICHQLVNDKRLQWVDANPAAKEAKK